MDNQEKQAVIGAAKQSPEYKSLSLGQKCAVLAILSLSSVASFAAEGDIPMPEISVSQFVTYIGLLVAAVATVASANLMIPMVAKGIKAIRQAF